MKILRKPQQIKFLTYGLYLIAIISLGLVFVGVIGVFETAQSFHRSATDWNFFWQPNITSYILLTLTTILCVTRSRLGILVGLYFGLRSFWFYFDIVVGNGSSFLWPNLNTYIGFLLYWLLFFLCAISAIVWIVEIWKSYRSKG